MVGACPDIGSEVEENACSPVSFGVFCSSFSGSWSDFFLGPLLGFPADDFLTPAGLGEVAFLFLLGARSVSRETCPPGETACERVRAMVKVVMRNSIK